ncbi:MAG: histidine phosphatase family protein [Candidatus Nanoarchaeia archaeon]|nr:histidine phosphatase family protein [Candidatus Nanoarchaeia archaeon]
MKLILTRHGQTVENQNRIVQGHLPGKLSEKGKQQAKKLALRLKDEKISAIYSSDLKRAADTAKEIAKYHKNAGFFLVKELRERHHGKYDGKKANEVKWGENTDEFEKLSDMKKRAKKIIDEAYKKYSDSTVVFVGHSAINRVIIRIMEGKDFDEIENMERQRNTAVSIFEIKEDNKHIIHLMNCTKHLD